MKRKEVLSKKHKPLGHLKSKPKRESLETGLG
jgi:hypothetical protein